MSFGDFGPFGDYRYPPGTGYLPGESPKEIACEEFVTNWLESNEYLDWCDDEGLDPDSVEAIDRGTECAEMLFEDEWENGFDIDNYDY